MGGGSLGFGSSKTKSQQTQESYGYSGSNSLQESLGTSQSTAGSQATSTQGIAFQDLFQQLYGGATNTAMGLTAQSGELTDAARMLFSGGTDFLSTLGGGADSAYMESRLGGENPLVQEQISQLGSNLGDFFRNELNPAITSQGVAGGTLGGGRQGVAQGQAMAEVAKQFTQGTTSILANDLAAKDALAGQMGDQRISAATGALAQLPGMFGLAESGFNAQLSPYSTLASILGGPTTLTQSGSTSFSQATSEDIARAISAAFGEDFSKGQSTSSGSAKNFNMSGSFMSMGGG